MLPCRAQDSVTAGNPGCKVERDGHSWVPYAGTYVPQTRISSHKFLRLNACEWVLTSLESLVRLERFQNEAKTSVVAEAEAPIAVPVQHCRPALVAVYGGCVSAQAHVCLHLL